MTLTTLTTLTKIITILCYVAVAVWLVHLVTSGVGPAYAILGAFGFGIMVGGD